MASPHAVGVAALIVAEYGKRDRRYGGLKLNPDKVEQIMRRTATDTPCPEPRLYDYPEPASGEQYTAFCDGPRPDNGFYGDGIVSAARRRARGRLDPIERDRRRPDRHGSWGRRRSRVWVPVVAALLVVAFAIVDASPATTSCSSRCTCSGRCSPRSPPARARPPRSACWRRRSARRAAQAERLRRSRTSSGIATVVLGSARRRLDRRACGERARSSTRRRCSTWSSSTLPSASRCSTRDLRYVRVNDRLAEINGVPAAEHLGRTIAELLPDLPAAGPGGRRRASRAPATPLSDVDVRDAGAAGRER